MTAVWRCGAEVATAVDGYGEIGAGGQSTNPHFSFDSAVKRSGTYSAKFSSASGAAAIGSIRGLNLPGASARAYVRLGGTPTTAARVLILRGLTGNAHFASLRLRTDRRLELILNGPPNPMTTFEGPPVADVEGVGALTLGGFLGEVAARFGPNEAIVLDDPLRDGETVRWTYARL